MLLNLSEGVRLFTHIKCIFARHYRALTHPANMAPYLPFNFPPTFLGRLNDVFSLHHLMFNSCNFIVFPADVVVCKSLSSCSASARTFILFLGSPGRDDAENL